MTKQNIFGKLRVWSGSFLFFQSYLTLKYFVRYRGPFDNKEDLLLLDSVEEWVGKHRPKIIGKIGADIAAEAGERTLQNILAAAAKGTNDNDSESDECDGENSVNSIRRGWVQNVGESRNDEDNISLYLRFSEGGNGEWREKGLSDLSKYDNKIVLVNQRAMDIQGTTSNIDEGEEGKIRPLYDLVFKQDSGDDESCGMLVEIPRGSALDVGMFHSDLDYSRQCATLEFWFFLPQIKSEIVLVRRSYLLPGVEIQDICNKISKDSMIWEIVVLRSGQLQFRTSLGSTITSGIKMTDNDHTFDFDPESEDEDVGFVSLPKDSGFGGWNHVSLSFSCRGVGAMESKVSLRMKGSLIATCTAPLDLPKRDGWSESDCIDNALQKSALMFGLGAVSGMRITEIRLWACKRASEDIKMMMYEYLDVAKMKKKFKISIRNRATANGTKGGLLMPPRSVDKPRALLLPGTARRLQTDDETSHGIDNETVNSFADFASDAASDAASDVASDDQTVQEENNPFINEYLKQGKPPVEEENRHIPIKASSSGEIAFEHMLHIAPSDEVGVGQSSPVMSSYSKESVLISAEIRKSAAAALIRGPPATRHFGGNRGGLFYKNGSR